jgi:hypothetical protein
VQRIFHGHGVPCGFVAHINDKDGAAPPYLVVCTRAECIPEDSVLITAASLKSQTVKDLTQIAKSHSVLGWSSMRKEELIKAIVKAAKASARKKKQVPKKTISATTTIKAKTSPKKTVPPPLKAVTKVSRRIQKINDERDRLKDLTTPVVTKTKRKKPRPIPIKPIALEKDRIVLMVRDSYWLHACWDISRNNVERAKAALAEHWHGAKPVIRVFEVETGNTTSSAEEVVRDIVIHGGVRNWYVDVVDPPKSYRIDIGYLADNGKFFAMARSNIVTTPHPGSSDDLDENWSEVAQNYEKVFALSGGNEETTSSDLQELFEERLRRPMGAPVVTRYGAGADNFLRQSRGFAFTVDAELIIYGTTQPNAHVTLAGEPVKIRPDGTFTIRQGMPDKRQVLPVVANSGDGVEQRTIVLAIERNTKIMEPVVHEGRD